MSVTPVAVTLYTDIRQKILSGIWAPGVVLRQEDLARRYATSRVPLREAFSRLEAEGFLVLRPRRGFAVVSLREDEIREIFDLRMVLESHAGQIATKAQKPGDMLVLEDLLDRMEATDTAHATGLAEWCLLNRRFHDYILDCCNRPRLRRLLLQLRDQVEPYMRIELSVTGDVTEASRDHREILSAMRSGDSELAGELCAIHCSRTARRLVANLKP
ncbi:MULTISPECIES: GntR family transcriptional regulator [Thioclava]|uniref:GntR family transcriptional regulator n=1 Tax=Thioclava kandeliae TaxID=3070818 RepID=A0ABV1SLC7_9RHOB